MDIKNKILKDFVKKYEHLAEQGSEQWLLERSRTIGGSEISTVIGCNKFSKLEHLISQKLGITSFKGNMATRWGSVFENVTEMLFQVLFLDEGEVYATGSIPHKRIITHRYSPDGLCVMLIEDDYKIILLEFKAPFSSIPNNKVPAHYLPQIKTGLCTIDIADAGIFISNVFRKCKLSQLNFTPEYDLDFHNDKKKKFEADEALAYGVILFYIDGQNIDEFLTHFIEERDEFILYESDEESKTEFKHEFAGDNDSCSDADYEEEEEEDYYYHDLSLLQKLHKNVDMFVKTELDPDEYDLIDLGGVSKSELEKFLLYVKPETGNSFLSVKYIKPTLNVNFMLNDNKNIYISDNLKFKERKQYLKSLKKYNYEKSIYNYKKTFLKKGSIPVAVLPWKLLKTNIIQVEKEELYLDQYEDKLNEAVNTVDDIIKKSNNMSDRLKLFDKLYPNNSITEQYKKNIKPTTKDLQDFMDM